MVEVECASVTTIGTSALTVTAGVSALVSGTSELARVTVGVSTEAHVEWWSPEAQDEWSQDEWLSTVWLKRAEDKSLAQKPILKAV